TSADLVVPGHIFPLRARSGGVLERAGHTEGSVDLARLAGCRGAAVICEIMNEDGSMARMPDLQKLAEKFELPIVTIPDLISYRLLQDSLVDLEQKTKLKTAYGTFDAQIFRSKLDGTRHLALIKGFENLAEEIVDVRVHMQRPLVDVFGATDGHPARRIEQGLQMLKDAHCGVFVYLTRQFHEEILGQDLEELKDFASETQPAKAREMSVNMDQRQIGTGAQILRSLGVKRMRVHTATSKSYVGLSGFGLEIVEHKIMQ